MHPSLRHTAHRPWPLPSTPWRWRQSWLDLAFIHQRVDAAQIQSRLPRGLRVQTFDETAWVGIVPFRMARVAPRALGPVSLLPAFPELNLRTYVEHEGKPGVWFFSLDAASTAIVFGGRHLYRLPYFRADIRQTWSDGCMSFQSARRGCGAEPVRFHARCRPTGDTFYATPGSFEHWASERYCLHSEGPRGKLTCVDIHHAPWSLRAAAVDICVNELLSAAGLTSQSAETIGHFSSGVDVVSYVAKTSFRSPLNG